MTPEEASKTLRARRDELVQHIESIGDQLDDAAPKDWEDAATEAEDDQVLELLGQVEQAEVQRIDAALARIDAGTYGDCVKCGEPIADKRLGLLPETPHCAHCAA